MKALLLLSFVALSAAGAVPKPHELTEAYTFEEFAAIYRPQLTKNSAEWQQREELFHRSLSAAVSHNKRGRSWVHAINKFSDWTLAEKKAMLGGYNSRMNQVNGVRRPTSFANTNTKVKDNLDWRTQNVLSPIKNQETCGGCWAFAATEAIESSAAISGQQTPVSLAVEQILQCTPNPQMCGGTGGCGGATAELAFQYAGNVTGLTTARQYPFNSGGGNTGSCVWSPKKWAPVVSVSGYQSANVNDRQSVMQLLQQGPVTIGVDASSWFAYGGGAYDGCNSESNLTLDHAVQLVGYETTSDGTNWFVRNSWGPSWGESGFITLKGTDQCVWDLAPLDGSGCPGGPSRVQVCGSCGMYYEVSWPTASFISRHH